MKNQSEAKSTNNELFEEDRNSLFSADDQAEGLAEKVEDGESYYDRIRREKTEETRRGRKAGKREIILIAALVLLVVGVLVVALVFSNQASWKEVSSAGHQYYRGSSAVVNDGTALKKNDEGKIVTKGGNGKNIITAPIYYDERDAFLLTEENVYYDPRGNERKCASAFTEFYIDDSGKVYAEKDGVRRALDMGFLYNGKDRYVFLEPMILETDGYQIHLSPLSYVDTTMEGDLCIFYYDTKEMETIACGGEVIAYPEGKIYTLELFSDSIIYPEGDRMLLFFAPEKLKALL